MKLCIFQPIGVISANIRFEKLHHIKGSVSTTCAYNESLPLLTSQCWLILGFSLFSMLILIVSADVTVSTSPSVDISTILCESISWVDFSGTLDSIRFYTTSGFLICRLNWDKQRMNNSDVLSLVISVTFYLKILNLFWCQDHWLNSKN